MFDADADVFAALGISGGGAAYDSDFEGCVWGVNRESCSSHWNAKDPSHEVSNTHHHLAHSLPGGLTAGEGAGMSVRPLERKFRNSKLRPAE